MSARSLNLEDSELSSPLIIEHRSKRLDQVPEVAASGDGTPEGAQSPDMSLHRPQLPELSRAPETIQLSPQQPSMEDDDDDDNKRKPDEEEEGEAAVVEIRTNSESGKPTSLQQQHPVEDNFVDSESNADVEIHNSPTECAQKIVGGDHLEEVEEEDGDDLLRMPELVVTDKEINAHESLPATCSSPVVETPAVTVHPGMINDTTECSRSAQESNLLTLNSTQEPSPESVETETGTLRTSDGGLVSSSAPPPPPPPPPLLGSTNDLENPPSVSSTAGDDLHHQTTASEKTIHRDVEAKNSTVLIVGEYSTYCSSSTLSSPDMHMLSSALQEDDELEELYASSTSSSPRYKTFCAILSPPDSPPPRIPPHELFMGAPSLYYSSQTQTQMQTQNQFGSGESSSNHAPGIPVLSLSPSVLTNPSRQASAHLADESKALPEIPVSTDLAIKGSSSPIASDDDCAPEVSLQRKLDSVKILSFHHHPRC